MSKQHNHRSKKYHIYLASVKWKKGVSINLIQKQNLVGKKENYQLRYLVTIFLVELRPDSTLVKNTSCKNCVLRRNDPFTWMKAVSTVRYYAIHHYKIFKVNESLWGLQSILYIFSYDFTMITDWSNEVGLNKKGFLIYNQHRKIFRVHLTTKNNISLMSFINPIISDCCFFTNEFAHKIVANGF